mmetsp:Transcript_130715/g.419186  ORF Transcript_130715/g.419186 Transcript_130715/m.419186 type:complete len:220 (-) Transcript_130715:187-846(-)
MKLSLNSMLSSSRDLLSGLRTTSDISSRLPTCSRGNSSIRHISCSSRGSRSSHRLSSRISCSSSLHHCNSSFYPSKRRRQDCSRSRCRTSSSCCSSRRGSSRPCSSSNSNSRFCSSRRSCRLSSSRLSSSGRPLSRLCKSPNVSCSDALRSKTCCRPKRLARAVHLRSRRWRHARRDWRQKEGSSRCTMQPFSRRLPSSKWRNRPTSRKRGTWRSELLP